MRERRDFLYELSLNLGIPANELAARMPEKVFRRYQEHAAKHMLFTRRMEVHLAQIAMLIAQSMGGAKELKIADFLFDHSTQEQEEMTEESNLEEAKAFFGFSPRKKG